jgi:hypothetical protein
MNELTEPLTVEQPGPAGPGRPDHRRPAGTDPRDALRAGRAHGGTELGFPRDRGARRLLVLNGDPVRRIADIDLATPKGTGRLALAEKVEAAA